MPNTPKPRDLRREQRHGHQASNRSPEPQEAGSAEGRLRPRGRGCRDEFNPRMDPTTMLGGAARRGKRCTEQSSRRARPHPAGDPCRRTPRLRIALVETTAGELRPERVTSLHLTTCPFAPPSLSHYFASLYFAHIRFTSLHFPSLPFASRHFTLRSLYFACTSTTPLHFTVRPLTYPSHPLTSPSLARKPTFVQRKPTGWLPMKSRGPPKGGGAHHKQAGERGGPLS